MLLCMNNFLSGLDIRDFGGASSVYLMWLNIGNLFQVEYIEVSSIAMYE